MGGAVTAMVYAVVLGAAVWASVGAAPERARPRPAVVVAALAVVAVPSLLQLTVAPALLGLLQRSREEILAGQLWRLGTALVVQDGGWPGALFNLAFLLLVGLAATRVWTNRQWLRVALVSGFGAQLWGLVVQPTGAGNSVVDFGLAGSLAAVALVAGTGAVRVLGAASLVGALVLLVIGDLHGGAAAIGTLTGLLLNRRGPSAPDAPAAS